MQAAASLQTLNEYPPQAAAVTRSQSVSGLLIPPEGKVSCDKPCNVVALSQDLVSAIRNGESEQAQALSRQLAQVAANLAITPLEQLPPASISVKVIFEDVDSNLGFVVLDLRPNLTIAQLKWKMLVEHGLPPEVQVWIIRRRIPRDADTLELCGLKPGEEESIYLYLTSRKAAGLTESVYQRKYGILFGDDPNVSLTHDLEVVSLDTSAVGTPPAATQAPSPAGSDTVAAQETDPAGPLVIIPQGIPNTKPPSPQPQEQGWLCPRCTYFNIPTRPGCEMCADKRPADYVVPANFQVPQAERLRLEQERLLEQQLHEGPPGGLMEQQQLAAVIALNDQYNEVHLAGLGNFDAFGNGWLLADEPDVAPLQPDVVSLQPDVVSLQLQNNVEEDSTESSHNSVESTEVASNE